MALVLDWKKKLGYTKDPFEQVVLARHATGLDDQKEKFNLFLIKEERYGTLTGEKGTGKTTFLTWMKEQLGGKAFLIDAAKGKPLDALLQQSTSAIVRKLAKVEKKPAPERQQYLAGKLAGKIILVDNAGALTQEAEEFLANLNGHVLCADTKEKLPKLGKDTLALKTPAYTHEQLITILRKRIESVGGIGTHPFDEKQLHALIAKADGNPARLLSLARERAIELSLKAGPPPSAASREEGVKRVGFLNIRIEKEKPAEVVFDEPPAAPRTEHHDTSHAEDAALLKEIVGEQPKEPAPKKAEKHENMDAMIKKLAAEFPEKKTKKKK